MFDLTIITPTHRRPAQLAMCLSQFQQQSIANLRCEHLVVSDGFDPHARALCDRFGARYLERTDPGGQWGSLARDLGIREARGRYLAFWDDDNLYEPHALTALFAVASGVGIGLVQTRYRCRTTPGEITLPRQWTGQFIAGDVDTMCVCVERNLALLESWEQSPPPHRPTTDFHWLSRLMTHHATVRFVPVVIGWHL